MTRCKAFYRKMKNLRPEWDGDNREVVSEFCEKESKTIYFIYDHIDYMDRNFPDWLEPVEKTTGSSIEESCEIEDDDIALLSEGASRELRKTARSDPDLHQETLDEVKKELEKGNTVSIGSVKQILRKKTVEKLPALELPETVVQGSVEHLEHYLEPGSVDLILTDPPYAEEFLPLWSILAEKAAAVLRPGGFLIAYTGQIHFPDLLSRLVEHLDYVWTFALIHTGSRASIHARNIFNAWKPIAVFAKPPFEVPWQDDIIQGSGREKDDHEWQQSVGEFQELIERFTVEGQLVVDPFLGSGTTLLAAKKTGRQYFGMDVDEIAVSTAVRRLSDE